MQDQLKKAKSIVDAASKAGVRLMYAENLQYAPSSVKAMEIVRQDRIGQIFMATARDAHSGPHSDWFRDLNLAGGGALIDLGIHDIQLLRMLTKSEVQEVYATTMKSQDGLSVEDNAVATMRFRNRALGTLEESWTTKGDYDIRIELYGKEGNLVINPTRMKPLQVFSATAFGRTYPVPEEFYAFGYMQEIKLFVRCVMEDSEPDTSGEDGLTTLRVVMAMYKSARTDRVVTVEAS